MFRDAPSMSLTSYLPSPKTSTSYEDEVYYVLSGKATWVDGEETRPVNEGAIIYVDRHIPHKFTDINEELKLLIIFAPPYGSLQNSVQHRLS